MCVRLLGALVNPARSVESIEVLFSVWTREGSRNHVRLGFESLREGVVLFGGDAA